MMADDVCAFVQKKMPQKCSSTFELFSMTADDVCAYVHESSISVVVDLHCRTPILKVAGK